MGLKKMIRQLIPSEWLYVLQKEHVIGEYVDMVYRSHCFNSGCGKIYYKNRIARIKNAVKETTPTGDSTNFWYSFDPMLFNNATREKWKAIDRKIQNYKILCG